MNQRQMSVGKEGEKIVIFHEKTVNCLLFISCYIPAIIVIGICSKGGWMWNGGVRIDTGNAGKPVCFCLQ